MLLGGAHVDRLALHLGLVLGRAHVDADTATRAVVGRHLDGQLVPVEFARTELLREEPVGCPVERRRLEGLHADRGVRAHHGALAAVDAQVGFPDRDLDGELALLVGGGAGGERPVDRHRRHRQEVTLVGDHRHGDPVDEVGLGVLARRVEDVERLVEFGARRHRRRRSDLGEFGDRPVDSSLVAFDDQASSPTVGGADRLLDRADRPVEFHHVGEREEARLHDRVDAPRHLQLAGDAGGVDREHPQLALVDAPLDRRSAGAPTARRPDTAR